MPAVVVRSRGHAGLAIALLLTIAARASASTPSVSWMRSVPPPAGASRHQVVLDSRVLADGSLVIATQHSVRNISVARYDPTGALQSSVGWDGGDRGAELVAIDSRGDVFVCGSRGRQPVTGGLILEWTKDLRVWKIEGSSGAELWSQPLVLETPDTTETPLAAVFDANDDLVLAYSSLPDGGWGGTSGILKLDGDCGEVLWNVPASWSEHLSQPSLWLQLDLSGAALVCGRMTGGRVGIQKVDGATGATLWGPVTAMPGGPTAFTLDPSGNVLVAGQEPSGAIFLEKYDGGTGSQAWSLGPLADRPTRLLADCAGDFFVRETNDNLWKRSANGDVVWGPVDCRHGDLLASPSGDLLVGEAAALTSYDGSTGAEMWTTGLGGWESSPLLRMLPDGEVAVVWTKPTVDGLEVVIARVALQNGSAAFVASFAGARRSNDPRPLVSRSAANGNTIVLARRDLVAIDRSGQTVWGPITLPARVDARDVAIDGAGDVIVAGHLTDRAGESSIAVVKYAGSSGSLSWGPSLWDGGPPPYADQELTDLSLDAAGDVYVTGKSGLQLLALKFSGANGAIAWSPVMWTPPSPVLSPPVAEIDPAGDLVIGFVRDGGYPRQCQVVKFSGALGTPVWSSSVELGVSNRLLLRVDATGNVVIADAEVVELNGSDGSIVWGPFELFDPYADHLREVFPAEIDLDAAGNVLLAGLRHGFDAVYWGPMEQEWWVEKRDGATGDVVWGPVIYEPKLWQFDRAVAVEADAAGNAIVVGTLGYSDDRIEVMKLAAATGVAMWGPLPLPGDRPRSAANVHLDGGDIVVTGTDGEGALVARLTEGLAITTHRLSDARCGLSYSVSLAVAGGVAPYQWSVVSGSWPSGFTLAAGGMVSGTHVGEGLAQVRVRVVDGLGATAECDIEVRVLPAPGDVPISATSRCLCPGGAVTLSAGGSFASVVWLPSGATTPTITVSPVAATTYVVLATGADGCVRRGTIRIDVEEPSDLELAAASLPLASAGQPYAAQIATTGGAAPFGFSLDSGSLPAGLTLDASGAISGVVSGSAGSYSFTLSVTDAAGCSATAAYVLRVCDAAIGDLDANGTLSATDLVIMANALGGNIAPGTPPFTAPASAADSNGDGAITATDLVLLANRFTGNVACLPWM